MGVFLGNLGLYLDKVGFEPLLTVASVMGICVILPLFAFIEASSHNPSGSKRIRAWNFLIASNTMAVVLLSHWTVYSLQTGALVFLGYVGTAGVTWIFSRWSGEELKIPKKMFVGSGWILGSFISVGGYAVLSFVILGIDLGSAVTTLPILTLFLVVGYPLGLIIAMIIRVARMASVVYGRPQYRPNEGESIAQNLRRSHWWNNLAFLVLGVDSGRASRRVSLLFLLSVAAFLSLLVTERGVAYFGWPLIAAQSGIADILLVASQISYVRLSRAEYMRSPWLPK